VTMGGGGSNHSLYENIDKI